MNTTSLRFFVTRTEIWLPLSGAFPLSNPLGLWITLQIAVMSWYERLARVHGEFLSLSSTSFSTTTWLNPSLRNISSISLTMVGSGLKQLHHELPVVLWLPLPPHTGCWLHSKTSCPIGPHDCYCLDFERPLVRLVSHHPLLLVDLDLISLSNYVQRGTSSNIPGNVDCSNSMLWPMVCSFLAQMVHAFSIIVDEKCHIFAACENVYLGRLASLFIACNGNGLSFFLNYNVLG